MTSSEGFLLFQGVPSYYGSIRSWDQSEKFASFEKMLVFGSHLRYAYELRISA
ncbi:hypothetical protein SAMN05428947_10974 [Mucilaginibacter sp. OK283]|nr:hypothetical protein SAMN05428947_10974 [Mucilaginibacter sp. OK283]